MWDEDGKGPRLIKQGRRIPISVYGARLSKSELVADWTTPTNTTCKNSPRGGLESGGDQPATPHGGNCVYHTIDAADMEGWTGWVHGRMVVVVWCQSCRWVVVEEREEVVLAPASYGRSRDESPYGKGLEKSRS